MTLTQDTRCPESYSAGQLISTFLTARSGVYRELAELRKEGRKNPQGDCHFEKKRRVADEASSKTRKILYKRMQGIGDELQAVTGALSLAGPNAEVLDICMAPGGYSVSALKYSPHAHVSGITLPAALGGHRLLIPYGRRDPRVDVHFADITMLATECGVTDIPEGHPDISNFSTERHWAAKHSTLYSATARSCVHMHHTPQVIAKSAKRGGWPAAN